MNEIRRVLQDLNVLANSPLRSSKRQEKKLMQLCKAHLELNFEGVKVQKEELIIPAYAGKNPNVLGLHGRLKELNSNGIEAVILQGSLATNEEVAYSDLDAMILLSDNALSNSTALKKTVKQLHKLLKHVITQDPLQHHGWFVTTNKLLQAHYDDFFPLEIFNHACVLYPSADSFPLELGLITEKENYARSLFSTINAVIQEMETGKYLVNQYHLKSTLSKFMLLPALYLQLKEGKGVYKKDSFELGKADFSSEDWVVMDDISAVRQEWKQGMPRLAKKLMLRFPSLSRKIAKRFAPQVDAKLKEIILAKSPKMLIFARLLLERGQQFNEAE